MANKNFSVVGAILNSEQPKEQIEPIATTIEEKKQPKKEVVKQESIKLANYKYNLPQEDLDLLKAVAMVKGITIKRLLENAIDKYLTAPEQEQDIKNAKDVLRRIHK